jgi:hypothetical protein
LGQALSEASPDLVRHLLAADQHLLAPVVTRCWTR